MSLSKEQKKELAELSNHLDKIEKFAAENSIDLDVFISEYSEEGYSVYATEKVGFKEQAGKRKEVFSEASSQNTGETAHKTK